MGKSQTSKSSDKMARINESISVITKNGNIYSINSK